MFYGFPGEFAATIHGDSALLQFRVTDIQVYASSWNVDLNIIAFFNQRYGATLSGFRRCVADG